MRLLSKAAAKATTEKKATWALKVSTATILAAALSTVLTHSLVLAYLPARLTCIPI